MFAISGGMGGHNFGFQVFDQFTYFGRGEYLVHLRDGGTVTNCLLSQDIQLTQNRFYLTSVGQISRLGQVRPDIYSREIVGAYAAAFGQTYRGTGID